MKLTSYTVATVLYRINSVLPGIYPLTLWRRFGFTFNTRVSHLKSYHFATP